jgi:hypothetical protein
VKELPLRESLKAGALNKLKRFDVVNCESKIERKHEFGV